MSSIDTIAKSQQQHKYTNSLIHEKSPYLLQHSHDPIHWRAWDTKTLEEAKQSNKLIFLSIGYASCHWCHVMQHESFDNEQVAALLNRDYVSIKIDREERPDVDHVYMTYLLATQGSGGWPLTAFLLPNLQPLYTATYLTIQQLISLIQRISSLWYHSTEAARNKLETEASTLMKQLKEQIEGSVSSSSTAAASSSFSWPSTLHLCFRQLQSSYDETFGGFGLHPKFPQPSFLFFLLRYYKQFFHPNSQENEAASEEEKANALKALNMVSHTLKKMKQGGIYDHLNGGFSRYSVTRDWSLPHFEKMTYDQSQLILLYLELFQCTQDLEMLEIGKNTLDYVTGSIIQHVEGGFFSSEDADSVPFSEKQVEDEEKNKKKEGAFYLWNWNEIQNICGKESAAIFCQVFNICQEGNISLKDDPHHQMIKQNTLHQNEALETLAKNAGISLNEIKHIITICKNKLRAEQQKRPRPQLDDKIITSWNGLMIAACCKGYQLTNETRYLNAATNATKFIRKNLYDDKNQTLIRSYRQGPSRVSGFCDDYAFLVFGLLELYQTTFDVHLLQWAEALQKKQKELFWDSKHGGYFQTTDADVSLLLRGKSDADGAEPSYNSISAINLYRLYAILDERSYLLDAERILLSQQDTLLKHPRSFPMMLSALFLRHHQGTIILRSDAALTHNTDNGIASSKEAAPLKEGKGIVTLESMIQTVHQCFHPFHTLIVLDGDSENAKYLCSRSPELSRIQAGEQGKVSAYICKEMTCQLPTSDPQDLKKALDC